MTYKREMIGFRCTPAERGLIESVAASDDIPVAELCRRLILPQIAERLRGSLESMSKDPVSST